MSRRVVVNNGKNASKSTGPSLALIEWLGDCRGERYTHNVDVRWIRDFEHTVPFEESYVVEWRTGQQPRLGWPLFDGKVIAVSDDEELLRRKMEMLTLTASDSDEQTPRSSGTMSPKDVERCLQKLLEQRLPLPSRRDRPFTPSSEPAVEETVLIGKSLRVNKFVYLMAKSAPSPGRVIAPLLRQAFSRKKLTECSYAGQKRTTKDGFVAKPALKKYQKMADIHEFVMMRFHHLSQSAFGSAVNSLLGPNANAVKETVLHEDSDSDGDN